MTTFKVTAPDGSIIPVNAPDGATEQQAIAFAAETWKPGKTTPAVQQPSPYLPGPNKIKAVGQGIKDAAGGLIRGAGSIGSTILYPYDRIKGGGREGGLRLNNERRESIDSGLKELTGTDPDSALYKTGKIGSEIMGTLGAGGVLAKVPQALSKLPMLASQAPKLNAAATALRTGGFSTGLPAATTLAGKAGQMAGRSAAAAPVAYASQSLIDGSTDNAGTAAGIAAALPPALAGAGKLARGVGRTINGPPVAPALQQAVKTARDNGYVIPPSQAKPTLLNRTLEGFSGKLTTAQNASARNQPVTQELIAKELGLPPGTPVSLDGLKAIRQQAGNAYEAVGSTGVINTTPAYYAALDKITASAKQAAAGFPNAKANPLIDEIESLKSPQFDASSAVAKIKELRGAADAAYASGNKDLGKALKDGSAALEDAIEGHLNAIGAPQSILSGFRNARQLIAKTYSVEKAMNATTGNVDAVKLGNQLARGKPLSGGIRDVAAFGQQFPKAAQSIERMGSLPQTSPLDWMPSAAAAMATGNPLMMAGVAARPAARGAALSGVVQNRLAKPSGLNQLPKIDPRIQGLLYRATPVAATSR